MKQGVPPGVARPQGRWTPRQAVEACAHYAVCALTSVRRPRATATRGQPQCHHRPHCRDTPARTRARMRRSPGTDHPMKMASATTRTRRLPRTGAISAPRSGRAAPPARLQPAGASAARWTQRPPAQSAPPASPSAPPAPWARSATKSPDPHSPANPASLYLEGGCRMALSLNSTPDP